MSFHKLHFIPILFAPAIAIASPFILDLNNVEKQAVHQEEFERGICVTLELRHTVKHAMKSVTVKESQLVQQLSFLTCERHKACFCRRVSRLPIDVSDNGNLNGLTNFSM